MPRRISAERLAGEVSDLLLDHDGIMPSDAQRIVEEIRALGRQVPPLMGVYEACEELDAKSGNLRKLSGFPEPDQELRMGAVWATVRIKDYKKLRRRRG